MKRVITRETKSTIMLEQMDRELVAYRCHNSDGYAVLTKLEGYKWGFVPLNTSSSDPRYVSSSWKDAIAAASKQREVYSFNTMPDMLKAMVNKEF